MVDPTTSCSTPVPKLQYLSLTLRGERLRKYAQAGPKYHTSCVSPTPGGWSLASEDILAPVDHHAELLQVGVVEATRFLDPEAVAGRPQVVQEEIETTHPTVE